GRIEVNQKGLDLLIEAYKLISQETNYPLLIAGSGALDEMKKLKQLVKKLKMEKKIKLVGRVSGDQKIKLMMESVCMVVPSRYETFSIVALEALAYGIPLVTF